jgi:hypothetical protein
MVWIYVLNNEQMAVLVVTVFVAASVGGLVLVRPWIKRYCYEAFPDHNEAVSAFISCYGVFYGITLGLIAVATWENHEAASEVVDQEAAAVAALYRDVTAFSEPARTELRTRLRTYIDYIIDVAWPQYQRGRVPQQGLALVTDFENRLIRFDPKTTREEVVFHETLDQFNAMLTLRQARLEAVQEGLPDVMWWVVLVGAAFNILLLYLVYIEPARTHYFLIALLSAFIGLMVFLTIALDHPFRGEFSITPQPFVDVRQTWIELDQRHLEVAPDAAPGE